jgi:hypothetical protein
MPAQPESVAQLRFVHAEANRGAPWAEKTVGEWHGQHFGALPKKVKHKIGKKRRKA